DLLGLGLELAEAAAARIDVEPEVAIGVAGQAVGGRGGRAVPLVDLQVLDRSGLAVDLADGDDLVGGVDGVIKVAVEAHAAVVGQLTDPGGGAEVPIGAVIGVVFGLGSDADIGIERQVIGRPHHPGGFAGRSRTVLELHRSFARSACACQIGR